MLFAYRARVDCQICLRQLEGSEPVYRMKFGPAINNGLCTSVRKRCVNALVESSQCLGLGDGFRPPEPCETCRRLVYNLRGSKVTPVICSPECRSLARLSRRCEG
jgi:hypothetical protein